MSVYTTVTSEQLSAWLARYSIGTLVGLEGVAAGIENTTYFVTTTRGRYVLTLFEKLTVRELPFYLNLMAHLARHGIPCPQPMADVDNEFLGELNGRPAAIVTFLPGRTRLDVGPAECAQLGAVLAELHRAGQSFRLRMPNPRGAKWWRAAMPQVMPHLPPDEQELLRAEVRFQALHRFEDLPRGVIHADLFRDNALFAEGRLAGVIDFYFACNDALLYDLAIAVNDWCMGPDRVLDDRRVTALVEAYRAVRPFVPIERGAWPVMLRAGALRFWVSRLHDLHLPRPGELVHAHDPDHFRDILRRHVAHEHDSQRLIV